MMVTWHKINVVLYEIGGFTPWCKAFLMSAEKVTYLGAR
jgi:hypothetical protein